MEAQWGISPSDTVSRGEMAAFSPCLSVMVSLDLACSYLRWSPPWEHAYRGEERARVPPPRHPQSLPGQQVRDSGSPDFVLHAGPLS